ncbi:MAG: potassium channel family protein [Pirellulaceae bacterium]
MSILVGSGLTMLTIVIHALGTVAWARYLKSKQAELSHRTADMVFVLCYTAMIMLFLQILEVLLWAVTWLVLHDVPELNTLESALYFSMVTFTALGFGDIVVTGPWRLLSGIQAMNGLLIFGWSTALLVAVLSQMLRRRLAIEDGTFNDPFSGAD